MILGPMRIIACPHCSDPAALWTMASGNGCGVRTWTDGYVRAPMWMEQQVVAVCHKCLQGYWIDDAQEIGQQDHSTFDKSPDPRWRHALMAADPSPSWCHKLLRQGFASTPARERTLRLMAWRRGNDLVCGRWPVWTIPGYERAMRHPFPLLRPEPPPSETETNRNLRRLLQLLTDSDEDRWLAAECHRELGEFEVALQILERTEWDEVVWVVPQLQALCAASDRLVQLLDQPRV